MQLSGRLICCWSCSAGVVATQSEHNQTSQKLNERMNICHLNKLSSKVAVARISTCSRVRARAFVAETVAQMAAPPPPCFGGLGEVRFFPSVQPTGDRRTTRRMSRGATARGQIGGPRPRLQLRPRALRRFIISRSEELYPGLQVVFHTPLGFISQQFLLEALTNTTSTLQQSTRARYGHAPD